MPYLASTPIIDWQTPTVRAQAQALAVPGDLIATARACFEFVRDEIQHSRDFERNPTTCRASDVLHHRTGYCYAKSHLLAALLRANGLRAGFCYQRLSVNDSGPPYSLHGFNAVDLPTHGWYRLDPRGNKPGVHALFNPPHEHLAFALQSPEEVEYENILPDPLPIVVTALQNTSTWDETLRNLPDLTADQFKSLGLTILRRGPR